MKPWSLWPFVTQHRRRMNGKWGQRGNPVTRCLCAPIPQGLSFLVEEDGLDWRVSDLLRFIPPKCHPVSAPSWLFWGSTLTCWVFSSSFLFPLSSPGTGSIAFLSHCVSGAVAPSPAAQAWAACFSIFPPSGGSGGHCQPLICCPALAHHSESTWT